MQTAGVDRIPTITGPTSDMILDDRLEPGLRGPRYRRRLGTDALRTRRHWIARDVHMPHGSPTTQQPPIRFASGTNRLFRERDRTAVRGDFDLLSRDDVVAHGAGDLRAPEGREHALRSSVACRSGGGVQALVCAGRRRVEVRAFAVLNYGEAPAVHDLPIPAADDAFLIRVSYAGVNPMDSKLLERLTADIEISLCHGHRLRGGRRTRARQRAISRLATVSSAWPGHTAPTPSTRPSPPA